MNNEISYRMLCVAGFIGFLVTVLIMPFAVRVSKRCGAISDVGGRHVGSAPIGRLGGASIFISLFVSSITISFIDDGFMAVVVENYRKIIGLATGLVLAGGVGFWDDFRRLPALVKFLVQCLAGFATFFSGIAITGFDLPFLSPFELGSFSLPITILWVVGIVNAVNLIDGLDGLAGGVVFFASIVNFVAACSSGVAISSFLMITLSGSLVGFLLYNWHPARIYLGDGGAYSLGYLLAASALIAPLQKASTGFSLLVPVLAAGLPIFDTFLTMVRRTLGRRGFFSPDRGHLHHLLLDAGISHRRVVIGLYAISCLFGSLALLIVLNRQMFIGCLLILTSFLGNILWGISVRKELAKIASAIIRKFY